MPVSRHRPSPVSERKQVFHAIRRPNLELHSRRPIDGDGDRSGRDGPLRALQPRHPDPAEPDAGRAEELRTEGPVDAGGPLTDPSIDLIGRWLEDLSLELERRIPSSADEAGGGR